MKCILKILGAINAEKKLVIAGNHDLDLDMEYRRTSLHDEDDAEEVKKEHLEEHATVMGMITGPLAVEARVTYLEESNPSFNFKSGARSTVYASPYQPDFHSWAFSYDRKEDQFNLLGQVAKGLSSIAQNPILDS